MVHLRREPTALELLPPIYAAVIAIEAEVSTLRAALRRYGQHEPGCALGEKFDRHSVQIIEFSSCDCGLSDVLDAAR